MDRENKKVYGFPKEKYTYDQIMNMGNDGMDSASRKDDDIVTYENINTMLSDLTNDAIFETWAYIWVTEN